MKISKLKTLYIGKKFNGLYKRISISIVREEKKHKYFWYQFKGEKGNYNH